MNIKENTKIIAEFMGIVCNENEYYNNGHKIGSILNFYSSWEWLMPVVHEIKKVNKGVPKELINLSICSTKREIFKAVVEFINQYNKNK